MAVEPDILAMDEPAANLDPRSRRLLINLLKTFQHSKIIASHDLDLIMDVCQRCIVIKEGTVVADGPVSEILTDKKLLEENNLELPVAAKTLTMCLLRQVFALRRHHKSGVLHALDGLQFLIKLFNIFRLALGYDNFKAIVMVR